MAIAPELKNWMSLTACRKAAKGRCQSGYQLDLQANTDSYDGGGSAGPQVRDASFEAARLLALVCCQRSWPQARAGFLGTNRLEFGGKRLRRISRIAG